MNKKLIFEEVSRMHTLMGVKNSKATFLLKEDISTGFARILGDFINASARGASEIELASILKTLNADEQKFLDEFVESAKKAGKSGDISLDSLIKGIAGADMYKTLVKTIQSNQDIFFSSLGKKFNIKSLPTALSSKQQADLIISKLYKSSNPQVRNIVQSLEAGGVGLLPAERKLFVGELRKLNDPTASSIADELESGFKILDDVDAELKGGSKTVDADYDELVFDEVSGEWVSKAEKEAGDADRGADAGDAAKGGDEGGDAAKGGDEGGKEKRKKSWWEFFKKESGETEEIPVAKPETLKKYQDLLKDDEVSFAKELDDLRGKVKKSNYTLTSDNLALIKVAGDNDMIDSLDPIFGYLNQNLFRSTSIREVKDLLRNYNDYLKSPQRIDSKTGKEVPKVSFDDYCRLNRYTPPSWFKEKILVGGSNVTDFFLNNLSKSFVGSDLAGNKITGRQRVQAVLSMVATFTLMGGTILGVSEDARDVAIRALYKFDPFTKEEIQDSLNVYFKYTNPTINVGGKSFNIYDPKLGRDNPNLTYKEQTPQANFEVGDIDKLEFGLDKGIYVSGRTFYNFKLYPSNEKLIGGSEELGYPHTLEALDTGEPGVLKTITKGTYAQDLKSFLAWCKTKNYTDCTNLGGKWEYKDAQGQYQQARFKDATVGWE